MSINAPSSVALRAATVEDLKVVASWVASPRECELWAGWRVRFPLDLRTLPDEIGFAKTRPFALVERDDIVAFGQIVVRGADRVHLARIIVAPAARRRGLGEALVSELMRTARRDWFERISLYVDDNNAPAISLYTKLGFRDVDRPADEPAAPGSRYMEWRARR